MPKSKLYLLFIITFFARQTFAQDSEKYYNRLIGNSSYIYPTYSNQQLQDIVLNDTLILRYIQKAVTIQQIIAKGAANRVYAIEIKEITNTELAKILAQLVNLPNLKYLKICNQGGPFDAVRVKLPDNIKALQQLNSIEFYYPDKIDLPDALNKIAGLKNLQTLIFTGYKYQLPQNITTIPQLKTVRLFTSNIGKLDVSHTNWQSVYICEGYPASAYDQQSLLALSKIRTLRKLDLEEVKLRDTAVLDKFTQLNTLRIYGFDFKVNPLINKIGKLIQLKSLSLRLPNDNSFSIEGIKDLKTLTNLSITREYGERPPPKQLEVISRFKNLEVLSLNKCNLNLLPDIFEELHLLKSVSLTDNELTELPSSLFDLPLLEYLNASNNKLTQLPSVNCLTCNNLKTLNIRNNGLTELPPAITRLTQLENINVEDNKLTTVPPGWQNLTKLKNVDLSENNLTDYPPGLQDNHSVENINITINNISFIPDITGTGYHLKSLNLDANPLTALPIQIGKYTNLEKLKVSNAKFRSLPSSLGDCRKLKVLALERSIIKPTSLPIGLNNAKDLNALSLAENPLLDAKSVFNVIFAMPRKHLSVDLHNNDITELPATKKWANTSFYTLNLSHNKIKTLPIEFAEVKTLYGTDLSDNLLPGNMLVYNQLITQEDMQMAFMEMGMPLPVHYKSKHEHVIAVLKYVHSFYNQSNNIKAVEYATQAMAIDIAIYNNNAHFDETGICRFNLKDYKGALKDFEKFINRTNPSYTAGESEAWNDKIKAHIALNQLDEAAKAQVKYFGDILHCQQALILCKKSGNTLLYDQLLDSTLTTFKKQMALTNKLGLTYGSGYINQYTTLLIMANKPDEAIKMLKNDVVDPFPQLNYGVRALLTAFTDYLSDPASFNKIKTLLQSKIESDKKIPPDVYHINFADFNEWLPYSNFTIEQQQHIIELRNIAK